MRDAYLANNSVNNSSSGYSNPSRGISNSNISDNGSSSSGSDPSAGSGSNVPAILHVIGNIIGAIMNIPNDVVGLALGIAGLPFGTEHWHFDNGVLNITGNPLVPLGGITFGAVHNYGPGISPGGLGTDGNILSVHEGQHTIQGGFTGPLYIPLNIIGGILGLVTGGDWHARGNFMETGPQQHPPRPW